MGKQTKKPVTGKNKKTEKSKGTRTSSVKKKEERKKKSLIQKLISLLKKRIKQKKKMKPKNEFRFNHKTGHMNYVFWENEDEYRSVGLTSKSETFGKKNMPLKENPKKGDMKSSYIRSGVIEGNKKAYSRKEAKNYQLTGDDKANVKSKIRHYKKEKRNKKN